jgi:hypothetical protein
MIDPRCAEPVRLIEIDDFGAFSSEEDAGSRKEFA